MDAINVYGKIQHVGESTKPKESARSFNSRHTEKSDVAPSLKRKHDDFSPEHDLSQAGVQKIKLREADKTVVENMLNMGATNRNYMIGRGVIKVSDELGNSYACKRLDGGDGHLDRAKMENKLAWLVNHPNVVRPVELDLNRTTLLPVATEFFSGKEIEDIRGLTSEQKMDLVDQLLNGLMAIHKADIAHKDLFSRNVLINEKNELKIIDFGGSQLVGANDIKTLDLMNAARLIANLVVDENFIPESANHLDVKAKIQEKIKEDIDKQQISMLESCLDLIEYCFNESKLKFLEDITWGQWLVTPPLQNWSQYLQKVELRKDLHRLRTHERLITPETDLKSFFHNNKTDNKTDNKTTKKPNPTDKMVPEWFFDGKLVQGFLGLRAKAVI